MISPDMKASSLVNAQSGWKQREQDRMDASATLERRGERLIRLDDAP